MKEHNMISLLLLALTGFFKFFGTADAGPPTPWPYTVRSVANSGSSQHPWYEEYVKMTLDAHNEARWVHGNSPLTWDPIVAENAEHWAMASHGQGHSTGWIAQRYKRRKDGYTGENMWSGGGQDLDRRNCLLHSGASAVGSWYSEIEDHDFDNPHSSHFTAVMYELTKTVGCGSYYEIAKGFAWCTCVCQYQPGHGGGQTTNIPRPIDGRYFGSFNGYGYFPGLQILFDHPYNRRGFECSYSPMGMLTRSIVHPFLPKDWVEFFCDWPKKRYPFGPSTTSTTKKPKKKTK